LLILVIIGCYFQCTGAAPLGCSPLRQKNTWLCSGLNTGLRWQSISIFVAFLFTKRIRYDWRGIVERAAELEL
jgi:hypothetical protein